MKTIPQYCQNCRAENVLGESKCRKCGTRLMLVVFPPSLRYDTNQVPSYYEDHLLERVTALELRLGQITEKLAATLDLMLRQTKTSHTDHLLLETLIESLNTLGAIEKETLTQNWRERIDSEKKIETGETRRERILNEILAGDASANPDLFAHLVKEGMRLLGLNEEKQAFRMLERAVVLSAQNLPMLIFIAENYFRADKFALAKDYLERGRKLSPKNIKILLLLGVIYADEGDAVRAEKSFKILAARKEKMFPVSYALGMIEASKNDWTNALAAFKNAAEIKETAETNYLIGCVYFQLRRFKLAERFFIKALEKSQSYSDAWFMLSVAYEHSGELEKAAQMREEALKAKETGAQCLEFLKQRTPENPDTALPFLRLKTLKNNLLTGGAKRLTRLFREELFESLN